MVMLTQLGSNPAISKCIILSLLGHKAVGKTEASEDKKRHDFTSPNLKDLSSCLAINKYK